MSAAGGYFSPWFFDVGRPIASRSAHGNPRGFLPARAQVRGVQIVGRLRRHRSVQLLLQSVLALHAATGQDHPKP